MSKRLVELLKKRENIVKNLMAVSEDLNGEVMIETDSYYNGGIFEDGDLEEVLIELNLSIINKEAKIPQRVKEKIEESLNFAEEIKYAKFYNKEEDIYLIVPYVDIENRFDETYADETIYFFNDCIV